MKALFCLFIFFSCATALKQEHKCKYHYTKSIMIFSKIFKSINNTVNIVEMIDKLSKATGETKLFLAGCLGILNDNNKGLFANTSN